MEQTAIREANDAVFEANLSRVEAALGECGIAQPASELPPIPAGLTRSVGLAGPDAIGPSLSPLSDVEMKSVSDDDEKMMF